MGWGWNRRKRGGAVIVPPVSAIFNLSGPTTYGEGDSGFVNQVYTVTRTQNTTGAATVNYAVTGEGVNPAAAADFNGGVFPSGTVTFTNGDVTKTFNIPIVGDTALEPDDTFRVTLSSPSVGSIGIASILATITNDDVATIPDDNLTNNPATPPFTVTGPSDPYTYDTGSTEHYVEFTTGADGDVSWQVFTHWLDANNNVFYIFDSGQLYLRQRVAGVLSDIIIIGGQGTPRPPFTLHRIESMNGFHKVSFGGVVFAALTATNATQVDPSLRPLTTMRVDWLYNTLPTSYTFGTNAGQFLISGGMYRTNTGKARFVMDYIDQPTGCQYRTNSGSWVRATLISNPVAGRAIYETGVLGAGVNLIDARQLDIPANTGSFTVYANVAETMFGVNLTIASNAVTNIFRNKDWRGDPTGNYQQARYPYINTNDQIASFPPGITEMRCPIPYCAPKGTTQWFKVELSGTYMPGVTVTLQNDSGRVSNFSFVAGGCEFQFTSPDPIPTDSNTGAFLIISPTGWASNFTIGEMYQITGSGGARVDSNLISAAFVSDYATLPYKGRLRFMDESGTNGISYVSSATGKYEWVDRCTGPRIPESLAYLVQGTGDSTIKFQTPPYIYDLPTIAAMLPNHPFGTYGNNVRIRAVAGAGALSITRSGYDITITLASGGSTVNQVRAALDLLPGVNSVAEAVNAPTGNGTGLLSPFGFTNMTGGYDGYGRDLDLEVAITLCNALNAAPWFTLPVNCSVDYATQFATYVFNNLNSALRSKTIFELGNELWNLAFEACGYTITKAIAAGRPGPDVLSYSMQEYAALCVPVFNAIKAVMPTATVTGGAQNGNASSTSGIMTATTGFNAAANAIAVAPYFYPDGDAYVGSGNDTAYYQAAKTSINDRWNQYATNKAIADAAGLKSPCYEGGQHDVGNGTADNIRRQRSDEMGELYGIYLYEGRRRNGMGVVEAFYHYKDYSGIGVGASGSWGLEETLNETPTAKKKQAYLNAIANIFPAYVDIGSSVTITGTKTVGQILTVGVPVCRNVGTLSIQLLRDGVAFGSPVALIAAEVTQNYLYTQVAGDSGKVLNFRLVLTNPQGTATVFTYQTANATATT